jgi:UDP-N-acetylmuramate--alanine ligase
MSIKHYHLIGIGGIGMGTLASLLLAKGHKVSGSDLKENELTGQLRKNGATISIGHDAGNVKKPDFVVYSSAVRVTNPEFFEATSRKIPILKRAEVLAQLVNEQTGITIAGAHGKTTTTSMVSSLLINAGLKPTTAVGGIINSTSSYNANLGEGKYFVAEADESDGTFLYFQPHYSIITNIDFEHIDHYKNWDGILTAFRRFIQCTAKSGCVIACGEDERLRELVEKGGVRAMLYGFDASFDVYAQNIVTKGFATTFDCFTKKGKLGTLQLKVPGRHNVLNAMAAVCLAQQLGISLDVIQKTLGEFTGVKRRFQLKGEIDGVMVVDDYGHHPTEITATLKAARSFNPKRLVTVFQPHRYSRTKFLLNEFVTSLKLADELILTDIYAASEKVTEGIPTKDLLEKLKDSLGGRVTYLKKEDILNHLHTFVQPGDLVLFLGAGDIYHLSDDMVKQMQSKKVGV